MPLVLAIEPDNRQAAILKRIVREKVHADLVVVDSRDAAIQAIRAHVPDVLLLSALMSPRDEDELVAHLRTLDGAEHLQTHTIPQLASTAADQDSGRASKSFFSAFRRKKEPEPVAAGCNPELFADEIRTFLQRAAELKADAIASLQSRVDHLEYMVQDNAPAGSLANAPGTESSAFADRLSQHEAPSRLSPVPEAGLPADSAWSSPFEWRKATPLRSNDEIDAITPEILAAPPIHAAPSYEPAPVETDVAPEPFAGVTLDTPEEEVRTEMTVAARDAAEMPDASPVAYLPVEDPVVPEAFEAMTPAPPLELSAGATELSQVSDDIAEFMVGVPEQTPVEDAPTTRKKRGTSAARAADPVAPAVLFRLMPLAMWARTENIPTRKTAPAETAPRTVADELRELMSGLAVPPGVVGVSYARGCRIRRLRVPSSDGHRADAAGPVILSRRLLAEQREST